MRSFRVFQRAALIAAALLFAVSAARAQDPQPPDHDHVAMTAAASGWTVSTDGNAFVGYNYQQRQFLDYSSWESQNWLMATAERRVGPGRLTVDGMLTLEPFTLPAQGSPQLFQTGETYRQLPLVNYQHPHDLVMGIRATYRIAAGRVGYIFGADAVGEPTLGPTAFMHRESARSNPQVPLTHHYLDSTHVTPGVVRGGVSVAGFTFESSVFRGAEPNEDRVEIERPRLDSWAARVQYRRGAWQAQVSGGRLKKPEPFEPFDLRRFTASVAFDGGLKGRPLRMLAAWGRNEAIGAVNGIGDGFLVEGDLTATSRSTFFGTSGDRRERGAGSRSLHAGRAAAPALLLSRRCRHRRLPPRGRVVAIRQGQRWRGPDDLRHASRSCPILGFVEVLPRLSALAPDDGHDPSALTHRRPVVRLRAVVVEEVAEIHQAISDLRDRRQPNGQACSSQLSLPVDSVRLLAQAHGQHLRGARLVFNQQDSHPSCAPRSRVRLTGAHALTTE